MVLQCFEVRYSVVQRVAHDIIQAQACCSVWHFVQGVAGDIFKA